MYLENDPELERCDEELRRNDERRKKILERKNRRIRQIREKQLRDKEAWMKKLIPLLDKSLEERFGPLYWYGCSVEDICTGVLFMEIAADPAKAENASGMEDQKEDPCKQPGQPMSEKNTRSKHVNKNTEM